MLNINKRLFLIFKWWSVELIKVIFEVWKYNIDMND